MKKLVIVFLLVLVSGCSLMPEIKPEANAQAVGDKIVAKNVTILEAYRTNAGEIDYNLSEYQQDGVKKYAFTFQNLSKGDTYAAYVKYNGVEKQVLIPPYRHYCSTSKCRGYEWIEFDATGGADPKLALKVVLILDTEKPIYGRDSDSYQFKIKNGRKSFRYFNIEKQDQNISFKDETGKVLARGFVKSYTWSSWFEYSHFQTVTAVYEKTP